MRIPGILREFPRFAVGGNFNPNFGRAVIWNCRKIPNFARRPHFGFPPAREWRKKKNPRQPAENPPKPHAAAGPRKPPHNKGKTVKPSPAPPQSPKKNLIFKKKTRIIKSKSAGARFGFDAGCETAGACQGGNPCKTFPKNIINANDERFALAA